MELVSIGTFSEKTIKASLTIEKELIYPSFNSNYESKNLCPSIYKEDIISEVEYGLQRLNEVNQNIAISDFFITFRKTKKIILDSLTVSNLTSILNKLAQGNLEQNICLSAVEIVIADGLI